MAVRKIKSPLTEAARREGNRRQADEAQHRKRDQIGMRSYADLVAAQTAPGAAPAATRASLSISDLAHNGTVLRIPAGATAALTVTGLAGWHHSDAVFTLTPYGRNMALPLELEHNEPGPDGFAAAPTLPLSPPLFVGSLICRYSIDSSWTSTVPSRDKLQITAGENIEVDFHLPRADVAAPIVRAYVGKTISKLTLLQKMAHNAAPRITAILPNLADGISIARDDDRVLHQVPRKLGAGDTARSGDLSDYLNEMAEKGDSATFRISSRTDCVLSIRASLNRQVRADGPRQEETVVLPWRPLQLSPNLPGSSDSTVRLTATASAVGPALVGLKNPATAADCQMLQLPPRVSLLQPFRLPGAQDHARRFAGVWLCLPAAPSESRTLQVGIAPLDPGTQTTGPALASTTARITDRQMDLQPVGDGFFAHWAAFDAPLDIDIPALGSQFALQLGDASGPVSLLECTPTIPQLFPALSRNVGRADRWTQRSFGRPAKVLLFELGEITDGKETVLTLQSGDTTLTLDLPDTQTGVDVDLPGTQTLRLGATRQITLKNLHLSARSPSERLG